jgi:lipoprotein-anchoring transpeptidase ErfK/SrfK
MKDVRRRPPILAVALLALAVSCTSASADEPPSPSSAPSPRSVPAWAASSPAPLPSLQPQPPVDVGTWSAVPRRDRDLRVWAEPGPGARVVETVPVANAWGQRLGFWVQKGFRDRKGAGWIRVLLPQRPNGSAGWIREDHVDLVPLREKLLVDLSERTLRRYRDGQLIDTFSVGVGTPATPTATGRFFVWATVAYADDRGPYGSFALGLSGFSDVITDWVGGGRMAIHGTWKASDRGRAVSYGCVRVFNPELERLQDVPMGTPVVIRP